MTPQLVYFPETIDGTQFPMYGTTDGGRAVAWFDTEDGARAYIARHGKQEEWRIKSLSGESAVQWLDDVHRRHSVTHLILNPQSDFDKSNVRYIPVDVLLLAMRVAAAASKKDAYVILVARAWQSIASSSTAVGSSKGRFGFTRGM